MVSWYYYAVLKGKHGNRHTSPNRIRKNTKNSLVMLDDIKAVAYDQLVEIGSGPIAPDFDGIIFKYLIYCSRKIVESCATFIDPQYFMVYTLGFCIHSNCNAL